MAWFFIFTLALDFSIANAQIPFAPQQKSLVQVPLAQNETAFIENQGQFDPQVRFQVRSGNKTMWLTDTGIVFDTLRAKDEPTQRSLGKKRPGQNTPAAETPLTDRRFERLVFAEHFMGGNAKPTIEARWPLPGKYNYFAGNDSKNWRANVSGYSEVVYKNVWPGVDVLFKSDGEDIEQQFLVHPGADPRLVKITYKGIKKLEVASDGALIVRTKFGHLRETPPRIYQEVDGHQLPVNGTFALLNKRAYSFNIKTFNPEAELIIDPTIQYSTFLGSSGNDYGTSIVADAFGAAYVTGTTRSSDFPTTTGSIQPTLSNPGQNSFITKLSPTSGQLVYSTYLRSSEARGIAVNAQGEAYITGHFAQSDFPITANAYQTCGSDSTFLTKLNAQGSGLVYSTCLWNDMDNNGPKSIAVDSSGVVYIAGSTAAAMPVTANAFQTTTEPHADAFLMVLKPTESGSYSLFYSTYLGGSEAVGGYSYGGDGANSVAVDSSGNAYIGGWTYSRNFPVTENAFQKDYKHDWCSCNGWGCPCSTGFIAKLNPRASGQAGLIYSTYLGSSGNGGDGIKAIAVDNSGNAYVAGSTATSTDIGGGSSSDFPTTPGAFQTTVEPAWAGRAFVAKMNPEGSALTYSTYLGPSTTFANGIAVDSSGNAYVTGATRFSGFPVTPDAFQFTATPGAEGYNAFLTEFNPSGSGLIYSTYLGGHHDDFGSAIALDAFGDVYVTGDTMSLDFPTTSGAAQTVQGGGTCYDYYWGGTICRDAFVTKFSAGNAAVSLEIFPVHGGNTGTITSTVIGKGLASGDAVKLACSGQPDIPGNNVTFNSSNQRLTTTFDLTGAAPGQCSVVITQPDGTTRTVPKPFTIDQGGAAQIWVNVIGRSQIRQGLPSLYYVVIGNSGNINTNDLVLTLTTPNIVTPDLGCERPRPEDLGLIWSFPVDWCQIPVTIQDQSSIEVPFWVYSLPAGQSSFVRVSLNLMQPPGPPHTTFNVLHAELANMPESTFSMTGSPDDVPTSPMAQLIVSSFEEALSETSSLGLSVATTSSSDDNLNNVRNFVHGSSDFFSHFPHGPIFEGFGAAIGLAFGHLLAAEIGSGIGNVIDTAREALELCSRGIKIIDKHNKAINDAYNEYVTANDPNELVGPIGSGPVRWISGQKPIPYGIFFENIPTASAPAAKVVVTDQLNIADEDLSTFSLGPISVADQLVTPPPGTGDFSTTLDLRPTNNLLLAINTHLDTTTGLLTWTFQSLDPATNQPPEDPEAGFLPPGAGGSMFFTVMPKEGLATNTAIQNFATIVFDANAPMDTPTWLNTIDNTAPTSHVLPLPSKVNPPGFTVQWAGNDAGAGVQDYSIFVSQDGGDFTPFLTNTTATSAVFHGEPGSAYAFYSVARDLTGNREVKSPAAEASTAVARILGVNSTGAYFYDGNNRDSVAMNLSYDMKYKTQVTGSLKLNAITTTGRIAVQTTATDEVTMAGDGTVNIRGKCTVNTRTGYSFEAIMKDVANPGANKDQFSIKITGPNNFNVQFLNKIIAGGDIAISWQ